MGSKAKYNPLQKESRQSLFPKDAHGRITSTSKLYKVLISSDQIRKPNSRGWKF